MTDVLWATVHQKPVSIYGFSYDPIKNPAISTDPVRIIVRNKQKTDNEFDEEIQKSHEFLAILETKLQFDLSILEKVEHEDGGCVWMFTVDKRWIHASPLFSMLSLFMRVGCYYKGGGKLNDAIKSFKEVNHNDARYLKQSRNLRQLIFKHGLGIFQDRMEDNYPPNVSVDTVHDRWGIVNAASCNTFKSIWNLKGLETIVKKKTKKKKKVRTKSAKKKAKKKVKAK